MAAGLPFGRFHLLDRIAAGGMGEVWVGVQTGVGDFRKPLAVKLMLPALAGDPEQVTQFLTEARLAARLNHANIVQVFDAGCVEGRYYLSMELVEGCSASTLIRQLKAAGEQLDEDVLSHLARQALEGLAFAHEAVDERGQPLGIVHRDVSPGNLLLSRRGEVKLADFGIARASSEESTTAPGTVRGKLEFLAPEVLRGERASPQSDLFAVGVTLYRLAALRSPFDGPVMVGPARPLATVRPDLSASFCAAVTRSLEAEPSARFPSARAMRDAFQRGDFEERIARLGALVSRVAPVPATIEAAPVGTADLIVDVDLSAPALPGPTEVDLPAVEPRARPTPSARKWGLVAGAALGLLAVGVVVTTVRSTRTIDSGPPGARATALDDVAATPVEGDRASGSRTAAAWALAVNAERAGVDPGGAAPTDQQGTAGAAGGPTSGAASSPRVADGARGDGMPAGSSKPTGSGGRTDTGGTRPAPPPGSDTGASSPQTAVAPGAVDDAAQGRPSEAGDGEGALPRARAGVAGQAATDASKPMPDARRRARLTPPALVTIQARPWAFVFIDGHKVGQTPLADVPITSARPLIRLENPDFAPQQFQLVLKAGEHQKVLKTLVPR
ncbi:MAG: protein kinase [Myxococcaceae bacterium]|nr:protein kinase [Myxococcaceae bacterium]